MASSEPSSPSGNIKIFDDPEFGDFPLSLAQARTTAKDELAKRKMDPPLMVILISNPGREPYYLAWPDITNPSADEAKKGSKELFALKIDMTGKVSETFVTKNIEVRKVGYEVRAASGASANKVTSIYEMPPHPFVPAGGTAAFWNEPFVLSLPGADERARSR